MPQRNLEFGELRYFLRDPHELVTVNKLWDLQEAGEPVTADRISESLKVATLPKDEVQEILEFLVEEGFLSKDANDFYSCPVKRGHWLRSLKPVAKTKSPKTELSEMVAENYAASRLASEGFLVLKPFLDVGGGDLVLLHAKQPPDARTASAIAEGILPATLPNDLEDIIKYKGVFALLQAKGRTGENQIQVKVRPKYWDNPLFFVFVYWINRDQAFIFSKSDWASCFDAGADQETLTITRRKARSLKMQKLGEIKVKVREIQRAINEMQAMSPV